MTCGHLLCSIQSVAVASSIFAIMKISFQCARDRSACQPSFPRSSHTEAVSAFLRQMLVGCLQSRDQSANGICELYPGCCTHCTLCTQTVNNSCTAELQDWLSLAWVLVLVGAGTSRAEKSPYFHCCQKKRMLSDERVTVFVCRQSSSLVECKNSGSSLWQLHMLHVGRLKATYDFCTMLAHVFFGMQAGHLGQSGPLRKAGRQARPNHTPPRHPHPEVGCQEQVTLHDHRKHCFSHYNNGETGVRIM